MGSKQLTKVMSILREEKTGMETTRTVAATAEEIQSQFRLQRKPKV